MSHISLSVISLVFCYYFVWSHLWLASSFFGRISMFSFLRENPECSWRIVLTWCPWRSWRSSCCRCALQFGCSWCNLLWSDHWGTWSWVYRSLSSPNFYINDFLQFCLFVGIIGYMISSWTTPSDCFYVTGTVRHRFRFVYTIHHCCLGSLFLAHSAMVLLEYALGIF